MSGRTSSDRGVGPSAPRTAPGANAKPSELERARMRRLLEGPARPARVSSHEQARSDVVLNELRAVRKDVAWLRDLVAETVSVLEANTGVQSDVLTRVQVAELLRLNIETVTKLVREDGLPCKRIGKEYRFVRSEVLTWLRARDVRGMGGT